MSPLTIRKQSKAMDANAILAAYDASVARRMGKLTTTSTSELDEYGRHWFTPQQFLGVLPADDEGILEAGRRELRSAHQSTTGAPT